MSTDALARLLTASHHCTQRLCQREWQDAAGRPQPINRWVAEVVCPHCQGTSSLFAILHRCRGCGRSLESPSSQTWQELAFPCCDVREIIPSNELLEPGQSQCSPAEHFQIQCPGCRRDWVAERRHAGRRVVCRDCEHNFPIPRGGDALRAQHPHSPERELLCRNCRHHIPVSVTACPICGFRPPFGT